MNTKLKIVLLLIAALFVQFSFAQRGLKNATRYIKNLKEESQTVGLCVTASIDGKTIYSKGFGYESLEHEVKADPAKTRYRIASISKAFTSAAIGILMNERKLNIDLSAQMYASYFPHKRHKITTRQIAGHMAGIRHYEQGEFLSSKRYNSVKEGLEIFMYDSLMFKPGTDFLYSSYGFNLVSAIIEGASGQTFLNYMQKYVFTPVKMTNTVPDYHDSIIVHRSDFYSMENGKIIHAPYVDNSYKWAGGGYLSTTEDIVKFGNAILYNKLFPDKIKQELIASQQLNSGKKTGYGLGWFTGIDAYGRKYYGHGGGAVGGSGNFLIFPEEKLVIAIYTNDTSASVGKELHTLADIILDAVK